MKYGDLIQFEPIETVIELREANELDRAKKLVDTYVISDKMADALTAIVFPLLRFDEGYDNKGLMVVGNYGTGKSHLMSVISSIVEYEDIYKGIGNEQVKKEAESVAGKYKVIRRELGGGKMPLADFFIQEIEKQLKEWGIDFSFPPAKKIASYKDPFDDMMAAFEKKFPGQGLLFVLDELLDFLRGRNDKELVNDLQILRVIGEVCKTLRFRFITGVQEAIFGSPRFSHVSDMIGRVKDRFEEIVIERRDINFVVKERLLKKTATQKSQIHNYLTPYTKYYEGMNERLDEFVELFPIHPDYIKTFQEITIIEKREVLKTFSLAMKEIIEDELPEDYPGLIAFDDFWNSISVNQKYSAIEEIREVVKCTNELLAKVKLSMERKQYIPMAMRIVKGLSVYRLTTEDISRSTGLTAESLRDALLLYDKAIADLGGPADETLLRQIKTVLSQIMKTVSGQYISINEENQQYYIDVEKNIDFDQKIKERAEILNDENFDRAYYNLLLSLMERSDIPSRVSGYQIWEYELEWISHKVDRPGYLFFGAPTERTTAHPEREFYLYFPKIFDPVKFKDEKKTDEVFFDFTMKDEDFEKALKLYAGALDCAASTAAKEKNIYLEKARQFEKKLIKTLADNRHTAFTVTYQGKKKEISKFTQEADIRKIAGAGSDEIINFRNYINAIACICLDGHFNQLAPEYPKFSTHLTKRNREQAVRDALGYIARGRETKQAASILDALGLLDGDKLVPKNSSYAKFILDLLNKKGSGQVVNRSEILIEDKKTDRCYMHPASARLEPDLVVILLAALVYSGDIVFSVTGKQFDAGNLSELPGFDLETLIDFKHIKKPKDVNTTLISALVELLDEPPGITGKLASGDDAALKDLLSNISKLIHDLVQVERFVNENPSLFGVDIINMMESTNLSKELKNTKDFLEMLLRHNTTAKLKNLNLAPEEIKKQKPVLEKMAELKKTEELSTKHYKDDIWLNEAGNILPDDFSWQKERKEFLNSVKEKITNKESSSVISEFIESPIQELRKHYIKIYSELHTKARLSKSDDTKKTKLMNDKRFSLLMKLSNSIDSLPRSVFTNIRDEIANLKSCFELTDRQLMDKPVCPHCGFRPKEESGIDVSERLKQADKQIDDLIEQWTEQLLMNLKDPVVKSKMGLLSAKKREIIESFLDSKTLPESPDNDFINALKEVFSDLKIVKLKFNNLKKFLIQDGAAVKVEELQTRFTEYLSEQTKGLEPDKVRITIEEDSTEKGEN